MESKTFRLGFSTRYSHRWRIGIPSRVFRTADTRCSDNQAPGRATWPLPGAADPDGFGPGTLAQRDDLALEPIGVIREEGPMVESAVNRPARRSTRSHRDRDATNRGTASVGGVVRVILRGSRNTQLRESRALEGA